MTRHTYSITLSSSCVRAVAIAALAGAAFLAAPLSPARADGPILAQNTTSPHKPPAAEAATSQKPETVEQRITELHADLKITPDQESKARTGMRPRCRYGELR